MEIKITEPYLWLPVDTQAEERKLEFYFQEEKVQELDICLGEENPVYYAFWDVSPWLGKTLAITGMEEKQIGNLKLDKEKPESIQKYRPRLHFSPETGWINDPNGLFYKEGFYHLYFQWNPYGVRWGNMHWGHAVSRDLMHWEELPGVLSPDETGTVFSGSAYVDKKNETGYGEETVLFYYTAAGGCNKWSKDAGERFTQRLAYSTDNGKTLHRSEKFLMEHIMGDNRDPKVFYHEESQSYIMILYLDKNIFAIFRSPDLMNWTQTQRLEVEGMWECPDLFELPVENEPGVRKWVFWSADSYYLAGDFDGYTFRPQSQRQKAYGCSLPYAAQTYSNVSDRALSIAWQRMENTRENYHSIMSFPMELGIRKVQDQYRLLMLPAREIHEVSGKERLLAAGKKTELELNGSPIYLNIQWKAVTESAADSPVSQITIGGLNLQFYPKEMKTVINGTELSHTCAMNWQILIDQEILEMYGDDGLLYYALELEENILGNKLTVYPDERVSEAFLKLM